jgi:hypothetical protein
MTLANIQYTAWPTGGMAPLPRQASSDDQLVDLWLHGRSPHTQRAYAADAERFRVYVGPLATMTLGDIQADSRGFWWQHEKHRQL